MKRVWLKSPADLDYLQALEWYEERQQGLGQKFDAELLALFERIKQNPELFPNETELTGNCFFDPNRPVPTSQRPRRFQLAL